MARRSFKELTGRISWYARMIFEVLKLQAWDNGQSAVSPVERHHKDCKKYRGAALFMGVWLCKINRRDLKFQCESWNHPRSLSLKLISENSASARRRRASAAVERRRAGDR